MRDVLSSKENQFRQSNLWNKIPKQKFLVHKRKSPATGLRIKVLQFPPRFILPDVNNAEVKTNGAYIYGIRSINKGPKNFVSLGVLPVRDFFLIDYLNEVSVLSDLALINLS